MKEVFKVHMAGKKGKNKTDEQGETSVKTKERVKLKRPSMYKVILLNDDYTPMDFVIYLLESLFDKTKEEATEIMLNVHKKGVGICGVYTHEVAETKASRAMEMSRRNQHPLQCCIEKE
jgi:ATP-dependent Clp protease adaptor protein ClpS